ncbi:hypothetical protein [Crossiella sp. NPDC003009]
MSTIVLAPAAAAATPDCTWQASEVATPDGYGTAGLRVTGVDGKGNYSGYYGSSTDPQAQPPRVRYATSGDMNAAGVQVVNGLRAGPNNVHVALTHSPETGYRELPVPPGTYDAHAISIADSGDLVGSARRVDNRQGGRALAGLRGRACGHRPADHAARLGLRDRARRHDRAGQRLQPPG